MHLLRLPPLWPLALLLALTYAQTNTKNLTIWNDSKKYQFFGCYNETTQVPGSADTRALEGGVNEVQPGHMTVPMCLSFCSDGDTEYRYAGLEWSRECWCAQVLAGIAEKLNDSACNYPCEGDNSTACGGSLKLSVYRLGSADSAAARGSSTQWLFVMSGLLLALAF